MLEMSLIFTHPSNFPRRRLQWQKRWVCGETEEARPLETHTQQGKRKLEINTGQLMNPSVDWNVWIFQVNSSLRP